MIVAEIYTQSDGKIAAFVLRGHSSFGGHGYDIYCAEVSVLSQSAYFAIRQYLNRDVAVENHEHGGLGVELKDAPDDLTEAVFQTMLIGLRHVAEVAPNVVRIEMIELDTAAEANLQSKINSMTQSHGGELPELNVEEVKILAEIFQTGDKVTGFSVEERGAEMVSELKIYCAGVWALTKAAFSCVKDYLKRELDFEADAGRLTMKLKNPPDEVTEAVFQTMLIGLREIEKIAPQAVKINS
ncbi:MAG: ribosomal-processing cysteine protease Prp [Selenomonadaceae bacterium]|nr:ribosomal-processing cysteine protease Prp [Selenomonadaceae bacterium]